MKKIFLVLIMTGLSAQAAKNCKSQAQKAVNAIEGVYGNTDTIKFKTHLVTKLASESLSPGNHEVTGSSLYQVNVNYGETTGKYLVTISDTFPNFECVISNVQYLGNILNK